MKKIFNIIDVPTGKIVIIEGDKGKLEFLSIGDYGRDKNVRAEFLGLNKEINGVEGWEVLPLEEKWVTTISTQYGCSMGCKFCDVPMVGPGINATLNDLIDQVDCSMSLYPNVLETKRFNLHYARMGEPTFNVHVLEHAKQLKNQVKSRLNNSLVHPVLSTMLPRNNHKLMWFLQEWCDIKNYNFCGDAGLQFSINTTDDCDREYQFNGNSLTLCEISEIGRQLPMPIGRKYTLNFAITDDSIVDAKILRKYFNPNKFMVKITPIHATKSCDKFDIVTTGGYVQYNPYRKIESDLIDVGFNVLVFIPSLEEDDSRITCGNAILSDKNK